MPPGPEPVPGPIAGSIGPEPSGRVHPTKTLANPGAVRTQGDAAKRMGKGVEIIKAQPGETVARRVARWMLGGTMVFAGISHLTFARRAFRAQVPKFVPELLPVTVDQVVVWSGLVEITMGASLILLPRQRRVLGWALGVLYVAIFPGNVAQWQHHRDAFGLNTDTKRLARLFGQPVLVAWALWSTAALGDGTEQGERDA